MDWKLQVAKRAVFGRVPFQGAVRHLKRQLFGYRPDPHNIRGTLDNLADMTTAVKSLGRTFEGATILEIGSGWFPTIPIMLSLQGARRIFLTDLTPHLDRVTFASTLDILKAQRQLSPGAAGKSTLQDFRLEYLAPFVPQSVPDGSIDFVISRTVLEHIPPPDILRLLEDLRPKLSSNGLMVHCIDHSDHLAHGDRSISMIDFLTWSARKHRFMNWLMKEGENRLRHHEYRELFERAGYAIVGESGHLHPETLALAKSLPMKERFATMSPEQVSVLISVFVLAPRLPGS